MAVGTPVVFGRPDRLLVGRTTERAWWSSRSDDPGYAEQVLSDLRRDGSRRPAGSTSYAVGALSFRPDAPALLSRLDDTGPGVLPSLTRHPVVVEQTARPERDAYVRAVSVALQRLAEDPTKAKVVLGRWLDLRATEPIDTLAVLAGLAATAPTARLFAVPAPAVVDEDEQSFLVGASPELLVARRGRTISATPMAGSVPRDSDPTADLAAGRGLLASAKDTDEHRYVADDVAETLRPWCDELVVDWPRLVRTDSVWHLATEIRGRLADRHRGLSALHLAQLLQPTPAVCGTPTDWALDAIAELEGARGAAAGAVGWVDATGDGTWAVAIRLGELSG